MAQRDPRGDAWIPRSTAVRHIRRLKPGEVEAIVDGYLTGTGSFRLAKKYGVSDNTVLTHLRAAGVEVATREERRAAGRVETREMDRLRREGWTLAAIGQRFGVSRQAVAARLKRPGRQQTAR